HSNERGTQTYLPRRKRRESVTERKSESERGRAAQAQIPDFAQQPCCEMNCGEF
ncbi:GM16211, partial [Drosophila sechellia]